MQVIPSTTGLALSMPAALPQPAPEPTQVPATPTAKQTPLVVFNNFEAVGKADTQSVVQAQIKETAHQDKTEAEANARAVEQQAKAEARTKTIMGLLPANPTEVTKLMSALAAATSAEAIADIKLDAQLV